MQGNAWWMSLWRLVERLLIPLRLRRDEKKRQTRSIKSVFCRLLSSAAANVDSR